MSTGDEASRFARFAFRRHFFQHLGFRIAQSVVDRLPVRLVETPVFVLGVGVEGKFLHTLVQFFSFRFTVVPGWCVLNQSFVRTFFPSVTQSDVRSFVLLVNCCILLQITLPPCLELMTTMFMSALQTTSTMTMQRSFCTVKFCLNTEMFWWVLIGYFRPTFYPCFKASVPAKPSRENEQMDLSQLNCVTKLPGKIARQNCVTKLPRRSWPEVAEYTEYKQLSRAFAAGVALDSLFWVHLLWFV